MLLFVTIVCSIFSTAWSQDDRIVVTLSKDQAAGLLKEAQVCGEKYGVEPNDIRLLLKLQMPEDDAHKKFVYCVCYNTGYVEADGHYNIDNMLKTIPTRGTQEDYLKNIQNCNKLTKENHIETAYEMILCFHRSYVPKVMP